jgi:CRP/FNR family transcriptional regulator, cyclic AMP receptor protein
MDTPRTRDDRKISWLASSPWWSELRPDDLHRIARAGDRLDVPAGRRLMRRGEYGFEAAMIVDGLVTVSRDGQIVATLGPGEVVGELSVIDRVPRNADVTAATDLQLLVFSGAELRRAGTEVARLGETVAARAAQRRDVTTNEPESV